jgi:imidazolonepropionase-like amidohydrolase
MGGKALRAVIPTLFAVAAAAALSSAQGGAVTAWTNGVWFDGTRFVPMDAYSSGDRLTLRRPARIDRTVDLAGAHVTGAFGEAHTHQVTSGDAGASIRTYLQQGIFYVMSQANTPDARERLGSRVNVPSSVDVAFAGGDFTAPGGHPTALVNRNIRLGSMTAQDLNGGFLNSVASVAEVDRAWPRVMASRPDFIKILLAYSEDRVAGIPRPTDSDRHGLDPSLVPHIVQLAHAAGLRVSAHVESAYDFEVAAKAGVDLFAHLPGFWPDPARIGSKGLGIYRISDAAAALAGRHKARMVTTIYETLKAIAEQKGYMQQREPMLQLLRHNLDVLTAHGVTIAIGSDQFRTTSVAEALEIHKAGLLPPAALLRALSSEAAATIFPRRAPFGPVERAPADFLVLDGDPLVDFTAIQRIRLRVKAGQELRIE